MRVSLVHLSRGMAGELLADFLSNTCICQDRVKTMAEAMEGERIDRSPRPVRSRATSPSQTFAFSMILRETTSIDQTCRWCVCRPSDGNRNALPLAGDRDAQQIGVQLRVHWDSATFSPCLSSTERNQLVRQFTDFHRCSPRLVVALRCRTPTEIAPCQVLGSVQPLGRALDLLNDRMSLRKPVRLACCQPSPRPPRGCAIIRPCRRATLNGMRRCLTAYCRSWGVFQP